MLNDERNKIDTDKRKLKWDKENRLLVSEDGGFVTNYRYDAGGERTVRVACGVKLKIINKEFAY